MVKLNNSLTTKNRKPSSRNEQFHKFVTSYLLKVCNDSNYHFEDSYSVKMQFSRFKRTTKFKNTDENLSSQSLITKL